MAVILNEVSPGFGGTESKDPCAPDAGTAANAIPMTFLCVLRVLCGSMFHSRIG